MITRILYGIADALLLVMLIALFFLIATGCADSSPEDCQTIVYSDAPTERTAPGGVQFVYIDRPADFQPVGYNYGCPVVIELGYGGHSPIDEYNLTAYATSYHVCVLPMLDPATHKLHPAREMIQRVCHPSKVIDPIQEGIYATDDYRYLEFILTPPAP